MKLPSFLLYPADWRKDLGVQALSYHDRGVWFEMLCLMHESSERGVLLLNGMPMPDAATADLLHLPLDSYKETKSRLLAYGVAKQRDDGALYNKRMVEDDARLEAQREAGHAGGNPKLQPENYERSGFLFAIQRDSDGATKLSIGTNPRQRLYKLRNQRKDDHFELIGEIAVSNMRQADEQARAQCVEKQIGGDWFSLSDLDLEALGFTLMGKDKGRSTLKSPHPTGGDREIDESTEKLQFGHQNPLFDDLNDKNSSSSLMGKDKGKQTPSISISNINKEEKEEEEATNACKPKKSTSRKRPQSPAVKFDDDTKTFVSISEVRMAKWTQAYPHVDIALELHRAAIWVDDNDDAIRPDYTRFLNNWLARAERGASTSGTPRTRANGTKGHSNAASRPSEERRTLLTAFAGKSAARTARDIDADDVGFIEQPRAPL